jgi:6-phosphogluconolactonase
MVDLKIYPDKNALNQAALQIFIDLADVSIREQGSFSVALSGGSTPRSLYQALAKPENARRLDWEHIHLFFGDERHVPLNHPDSNFRMVQESLLDRILIPNENVHRVRAEIDVHRAARAYEETLRTHFKGEWPCFDLVLLGMGADGHTASLFPKSAGLKEEKSWFIANYAPEMETWRLTLTKNAINHARNILVVVQGEDKAQMLAEVLEGGHHPVETPIQMISPKNGRMVWLVDHDATQQLSGGFRTGGSDG